MPRIKATSLQLEKERLEDRRRYTSEVIKMWMKVKQIQRFSIVAKLQSLRIKLAERTMKERILHPGSIRLDEFWVISDMLGLSDTELLKIMRGSDYVAAPETNGQQHPNYQQPGA